MKLRASLLLGEPAIISVRKMRSDLQILISL